MSSNQNHVDTASDSFVAEFETMDLRPLYDMTFLIAVNRGDLNDVKALCSTMRGPYNFEEMVEEVGNMWRKHMHHAKVFQLVKDRKQRMLHLDAGTINYIEANFEDIVTNYVLNTEILGTPTCTAGLNGADYAEEDEELKKKVKEEGDA